MPRIVKVVSRIKIRHSWRGLGGRGVPLRTTNAWKDKVRCVLSEEKARALSTAQVRVSVFVTCMASFFNVHQTSVN